MNYILDSDNIYVFLFIFILTTPVILLILSLLSPRKIANIEQHLVILLSILFLIPLTLINSPNLHSLAAGYITVLLIHTILPVIESLIVLIYHYTSDKIFYFYLSLIMILFILESLFIFRLIKKLSFKDTYLTAAT